MAQIPLHKAALLQNNRTLPLVPAATDYVTGLAFDDNTTRLLTTIKEDIETRFSSRILPRITIAHLMSLHFGPEDGMCYEHFGETIRRDMSQTQIQPQELDTQWAQVPYVSGHVGTSGVQLQISGHSTRS